MTEETAIRIAQAAEVAGIFTCLTFFAIVFAIALWIFNR